MWSSKDEAEDEKIEIVMYSTDGGVLSGKGTDMLGNELTTEGTI